MNKEKLIHLFKHKISQYTIKSAVILLTIFSLYLFFSQSKFQDKLFNGKFSNLVEDFGSKLSQISGVENILSWVKVDTSNLPIHSQEDLIEYKLNVLSKSLNNYFESTLSETDGLVQTQTIKNMYLGQSKTSAFRVRAILKSYLSENLDLLEISLYDLDFNRITAVKYKQADAYKLSPGLADRLSRKDNVLLKHSANPNLVMVSTIRDNRNKPIGYVSQTIHEVFFTKILDFLHLNDKIFFIKNTDGDLVLDNYEAKSFTDEQNQSFTYTFYKNLRKSKESTMGIRIDDVDYKVGVIVEENNMAGHLMVLFGFTFIIYLASLLINLLWQQTALFYKRVKGSKAETEKPIKASEKKPETSAEKKSDLAALDQEISRLMTNVKSRSSSQGELSADSFIRRRG